MLMKYIVKRSTDLDVLKKEEKFIFFLKNYEVSEKSWQNCLQNDNYNVVCHEKLIALYCEF